MSAKYVLITAARNEEAYICKPLESVVAQTVLPQRWIIVNDGSTDRTGEIVASFAERFNFIEPLSRVGDQRRNFGSKSRAVNYAYEQLSDVDFDYIGILDADIALDSRYYETILNQMAQNPRLGLAGGIRYDLINSHFELRDCARNSVSGSIQLFRRACFEEIGGYTPLQYGGVDAVAEMSARMLGWQVQSFPEFRVYHYRATGTAGRSTWTALYRAGIRDYTIGYHPLFELVRSVPRMRNRPFVIGAWITLAGYVSAYLHRVERFVPPELISYLHQEQLNRLKQAIWKHKASNPS